MRVAPVSGDLLVKAVLVIGGVALAAWAVARMRQAAGDAAGAVWNGIASAAEGAYNLAGNAAQAVNPFNNDNVFYRGTNEVLFPSGNDTLGTWIYDALNPAPTPEYEFMGPPNIYAGQGNHTSVTPAYNGPGGAAFGVYPRPFGGGASGSW